MCLCSVLCCLLAAAASSWPLSRPRWLTAASRFDIAGRTRTSATTCPVPWPPVIKSTHRYRWNRVIQEHHERRGTGMESDTGQHGVDIRPPNCQSEHGQLGGESDAVACFRESRFRTCSPLPGRLCLSSAVTPAR
ncbi:hypothetical protein N657DRAFT_414819 [Parathielavia appendiculata]|uniref:Secreted protein n=1 Tax=Parathielavia appendiculata TaxID=2587402 RepID=A0AAN6TZB8_9PEZI|nr:hypothetical protein N657DRAFT_414819 [Parathielavia appendiculata]